jgi:hypothetical protein
LVQRASNFGIVSKGGAHLYFRKTYPGNGTSDVAQLLCEDLDLQAELRVAVKRAKKSQENK